MILKKIKLLLKNDPTLLDQTQPNLWVDEPMYKSAGITFDSVQSAVIYTLLANVDFKPRSRAVSDRFPVPFSFSQFLVVSA